MKFIKKHFTDILFWSIIFIIALIDTIKILMSEFNLESNFSPEFNSYLVISILYIFMLYVVFAIFKVFYLSIPYFGAKVAKLASKRQIKEKINEEDLKNTGYYRGIISNYSPAVLSYIHSFNIETKDVAATLLSLKLKDKIQIDSNSNISIINKSYDNLELNEIYIFDCITNKEKIFNINTFKDAVIKDCINLKLLSEKNDIKSKMIKKILLFVAVYILLFRNIDISLPMTNNMIINILLAIATSILLFGTFVLTVLYPFISFVYLITYYIKNKENPYILNKISKDINTKLTGLEKYIKDFSLLEEKDHNSLILWEDYLIYSVILGINETGIDELVQALYHLD